MVLGSDEVNIVILNHVVHFLMGWRAVLDVERREADDHFISEDTKCPPVNWERMAFLLQHLRRNILGGSAEGISLLIKLDFLGNNEVRQLQVAVLCDHNILRLQISIDNFVVV